MPYYETPAGAKWFAADGVMNPQVQQVVSNLWENLSR
jgi:hypothetical protein